MRNSPQRAWGEKESLYNLLTMKTSFMLRKIVLCLALWVPVSFPGPAAAGRAADEELLWAAQYEKVADIDRALRNGGSVTALDVEGDTPLILAVRHNIDGHKAVARLLRAKADVNGRNAYGETALMDACVYGDIQTVDILVKAGADVNAVDNTGGTALMTAAGFANNPACLRFMLGLGVDVNAADNEGATALMLAARQRFRDLEAVDALVKAGARVNAVDRQGRTALHYALRNALEEDILAALDRLLANGGDLAVGDAQGLTPLMYAVRDYYRGDAIPARLVAGGACVNARDIEGRTALMYGAMNSTDYNGKGVPGAVGMANFLLAAGADPGLSDKHGLTALDYLRRNPKAHAAQETIARLEKASAAR